MKAWINEHGNWCFEFEKAEQEVTRLLLLVSAGVAKWEKKRNEYPEAYISVQLFDNILGEVILKQNYTQEHPTIDNPYHFTSKSFLEHEIDPDKPYPTRFNEKELEIMRTKDIKDLL